jgi:hypothetical protein
MIRSWRCSGETKGDDHSVKQLFFSIWVAGLVVFSCFPVRAQGSVQVYPAAVGEPLSTQFKVRVKHQNVPVYLARVSSLTPEQRQNLGSPIQSQTTTTSFASFDMAGTVRVTVTCTDLVQSVKLLPTSRGITPTFAGRTVTFTVNAPGQLTLEVNGNWISSLHLFADPMETDVPSPHDPNVIYFGPGLHQVQSIPVTSGKTVYLAGGAIVYGHPEGAHPGTPIFLLNGSNIVLRGRGIIDGSLCPRSTRSILNSAGTNITIEGVVLRDACGFTMPVARSNQVKIRDVKIFGWRGNSDGIDICNSRQVDVRDCFVRTFDDLIVLKTDIGQGELRDVTVENCVLWNEFAHALSLGAELREPLTHVVFSNCDVIHDKGRAWVMRVFNCDSAPVKDVTFDHIRVEEARHLMSLWIGKAMWSKQNERGRIDGVTFRDIQSVTPVPGPIADLAGFDGGHAINDVLFQDVVVGGHPLQLTDIHQNAFVHDVKVMP